MIDADKHKAPQQFNPAGPRDVLAYLLWGLAVLGCLPGLLRQDRAGRTDGPLTKLAALAVMPVTWAAGGGGTPGYLWLAWLVFAGLLVAAHGAVARAARRGVEISSRYIGRPLPDVLRPGLGHAAYLVWEPLMFLAAAGLLSAGGEPGLGLVLAGGAVALPAEYLVCLRRDRTIEQDALDARVYQQDLAGRLRNRTGGW